MQQKKKPGTPVRKGQPQSKMQPQKKTQPQKNVQLQKKEHPQKNVRSQMKSQLQKGVQSRENVQPQSKIQPQKPNDELSQNNEDKIRGSVIQWYPGHMTGALRMMKESIKLIDIVIELLDARVPLSSKNPDIDKLAEGKFRLIIMNKIDLADPAITKRWKAYYEEKGFSVILMDSRSRKDAAAVSGVVREVCREKLERDRNRGILGSSIKAMIVGIPNVGKSTFINAFSGKASTKTGNKPGVTRGKQWIKIAKDMDLLDTPGILWPKFEDQMVGKRLAWIGSINDDILDKTELALDLTLILQKTYCNILQDRYKIMEGMSGLEALYQIAEIRKCLKKGSEPDIDKAAVLLLDDLRSGRLGRITLEEPEQK